MSALPIHTQLQTQVAEALDVVAEGLDRYRVLTPFMFGDGDHLVILLRRNGACWELTDEGHTYMHLSYQIDVDDLAAGTRRTVIERALAFTSVEDREGELVLRVPEDRVGDALFSFCQALLQIADVTYLSRERAHSTFLEDFRSLMHEAAGEQCEFGWHDPRRDPEEHYVVDCRVNGRPRPLFVYALTTDNKVQQATIALQQFEIWRESFLSVAVFERQEEIGRKVLARFSNVCDKQFSCLQGNTERIEDYIRRTTQAA